MMQQQLFCSELLLSLSQELVVLLRKIIYIQIYYIFSNDMGFLLLILLQFSLGLNIWIWTQLFAKNKLVFSQIPYKINKFNIIEWISHIFDWGAIRVVRNYIFIYLRNNNGALFIHEYFSVGAKRHGISILNCKLYCLSFCLCLFRSIYIKY